MATAVFFSEQLDFIVSNALSNLSTLACHPYGCRVLWWIHEYCVESHAGIALENISKCHRKTFDHQCGNHVIQHVLQFGCVRDRDLALEMIVENGLLKLSRQKFLSNVVEKLLKYGNTEQHKSIVREMLKFVNKKNDRVVEDAAEGTSVILLMVRDPYTNYVVQNALDVLPGLEEMKGLIKELSAHSTELVSYLLMVEYLTFSSTFYFHLQFLHRLTHF